MFSLSGKYALVTGGSRGIGRGIALALAGQGANVAVNFRAKKEEAEMVVDEIKKLGRESFAVGVDVSDSTQVIAMFGQIKKRWGRLDILVNNAGIVEFADFENLATEQWEKVLAVNLKGQFLCAREAVKLMKPGGWGRIINIASIASGGVGIGFTRISHYVASKGGVVALTESMAIELAKYGINVMAVAPGVIETDMTAGMLSDEKAKQALLARVPKGRVGTPSDIGAACAFLTSEEADYITGSVLYVDGGWLAG